MKLNIAAIFTYLVASGAALTLPASEQQNQRRDQNVVQQQWPTPPPKEDPWYTAPSNYQLAQPGDILKVREITGMIGYSANAVNASRIIQLLYASTDSHYQPSWGVTTLLVPYHNMTSHTKVLSYQVATDSCDLDQAPSYIFQTSGFLQGSDVTQALGRGWYVNIPDFQGPQASFTAGVQAGHSTIDSVRATLGSDFGIDEHARIALWGYSGGALGSEWALELAVQYAPELTFVGAALGGTTPDVLSVYSITNGTGHAGIIPASFLGLSTQWPDLNTYIQAELYQTGIHNATFFNAAFNESIDQTNAAYNNTNIDLFFKNGGGVFESGVSQHVFNTDGKMGYHGVPQCPLYIYKAIADEISPISDTDALVDKYCAVGATINYLRNNATDHSTEAVVGDSGATHFLESVLDGTYNATGCLIQNVSTTIST